MECWNKYHCKYCGKLLIQFLHEDIVRKYINELTDEYFYLSRRFVNVSWLKLDVKKLKRNTSKVNNYTKHTNEEKISQDIYEPMFDANPNLKELIEQLNLSPTNLEDESLEHFNDTIF